METSWRKGAGLHQPSKLLCVRILRIPEVKKESKLPKVDDSLPLGWGRPGQLELVSSCWVVAWRGWTQLDPPKGSNDCGRVLWSRICGDPTARGQGCVQTCRMTGRSWDPLIGQSFLSTKDRTATKDRSLLKQPSSDQ